MLIDDIDFADLYLQQLKLAHRTEKTPDHWDQRAEKMAENCASPTDNYLQQLVANHRRFLADNQDWSGAIDQLRRHAPEKKIVVEADTPEEALAALRAQPDVLQLDKFSPAQAVEIAQIAPSLAPNCTLALTGGINLLTLKNYLDCGIRLFITSAPYYASPADIKVKLKPEDSF
ncbi:ModD protein [Escherichia albertii]|nr:ModD protein [Escherichia albertii]